MTGRHGGGGDRKPLISDGLTTVVIVVVLVVWVVNFGAALLLPGYQPSEAVNATFGVIVAALYARRARNGGGDEP